jgi:hypothetical protein
VRAITKKTRKWQGRALIIRQEAETRDEAVIDDAVGHHFCKAFASERGVLTT